MSRIKLNQLNQLIYNCFPGGGSVYHLGRQLGQMAMQVKPDFFNGKKGESKRISVFFCYFFVKSSWLSISIIENLPTVRIIWIRETIFSSVISEKIKIMRKKLLADFCNFFRKVYSNIR